MADESVAVTAPARRKKAFNYATKWEQQALYNQNQMLFAEMQKLRQDLYNLKIRASAPPQPQRNYLIPLPAPFCVVCKNKPRANGKKY